MKTKFCLATLALLCPLLWIGCATAPHVVDEHNKTTSMGLDTQDIATMANDMIQSMLQSPTFEKYGPNKRAIFVVGHIVNDTHIPMGKIDTDLLAKKIRIALNQSGKAFTDTTGGQTDPDFRLTGKIIETYIPQGNARQRTYTLQLSLANPQGLAVWEDEREVTKAKTRGGLGL